MNWTEADYKDYLKRQGEGPEEKAKKRIKAIIEKTLPVRSTGEETFDLHCQLLKLPQPVMEYRFHPVRKWRFDFAWPQFKLAVEVEGGTKGKSRHTSHDGFTNDCIKYNTATLMGWRVLRFTTDMVNKGEAINTVEEALKDA